MVDPDDDLDGADRPSPVIEKIELGPSGPFHRVVLKISCSTVPIVHGYDSARCRTSFFFRNIE
jgi:hypothetical protein